MSKFLGNQKLKSLTVLSGLKEIMSVSIVICMSRQIIIRINPNMVGGAHMDKRKYHMTDLKYSTTAR